MAAPKLRFKAFDENWEKVKFSEKFNFHSTNSYSRALLSENGEIMNIHYGDIHTKFSMLFNVTKEQVPFLSDEVDIQKISQNQFLQVGDLVIADASEDYKDIGKTIEIVNLDNQKIVAGLHTYIARPNHPFALGFSGYLMQTFEVREQIKKLATGISVLGISKTNLGKVELRIPYLEEQTKIASFLSAVDEKINQLTQKHELLSQYKQGMMQKLFSQQIRFKADNGSEFGEWEKVKLGSLLIKHDEKTEFNNQYPVLTSSRHGIYFQKDYFAGQDVASADTTGYNVVPYDYFTYRHMSDDLVFKFNINTICPKGIVSTLYPVFTVKVEHLNKYFLQTILNEGQEFKNFAIMQKQGGSRTYMYFSKLSELFLTIPCLEEQIKIANFLSAIDEKIEVVAQQIEQAKQWKKGLLQQMFV